MKLFNKPKWLNPELNEPKYWVHLAILATVALWILQYPTGSNMLTIKNVFWSIPILAVGDLVAHTLLKLD